MRQAGAPSDRRAAPSDGAVRTRPRPAGPLVARRELADPRRPDRPVPPRPSAARPSPARQQGRVRRWIDQYGWRAYAIPLLTLATVAVLLDLAVRTPAPAPDTAGATASAAASADVDFEPPPPPDQESPPMATDAAVAPAEPPPVEPAGYVERGAGTVTVVDGAGPVHGSGPLQRFVVEVEDGIDVDVVAFAEAVEATLADSRSWGSGGRMSFQRVGVPQAVAGDYDFKVTLISPGSMERYCPGVGTGGYTSCRYGERAVINLARWATAVPDYEGDVATYRQYVVNHEVGHVLGNGHQPCPGPGQLAPVMQQQTLGLDGCTKNAWPYP